MMITSYPCRNSVKKKKQSEVSGLMIVTSALAQEFGWCDYWTIMIGFGSPAPPWGQGPSGGGSGGGGGSSATPWMQPTPLFPVSHRDEPPPPPPPLDLAADKNHYTGMCVYTPQHESDLKCPQTCCSLQYPFNVLVVLLPRQHRV